MDLATLQRNSFPFLFAGLIIFVRAILTDLYCFVNKTRTKATRKLKLIACTLVTLGYIIIVTLQVWHLIYVSYRSCVVAKIKVSCKGGPITFGVTVYYIMNKTRTKELKLIACILVTLDWFLLSFLCSSKK